MLQVYHVQLTGVDGNVLEFLITKKSDTEVTMTVLVKGDPPTQLFTGTLTKS